jgi:glucose-1-phosphate thymidylyltransferase
MNVVFLCAGYGTRLYPLTEYKPKALLPIAGEPLLNHLIRKLEPISSLDRIVLVSNGRFHASFCEWQRTLGGKRNVSVINDGTLDPGHRLGAIQDLKLALDLLGARQDTLVLAGDNLFDAPLAPFVSFAEAKRPGCSVGVYDVRDKNQAKKFGLIKMDASSKITSFLEKPKEPPVTLASMGIYYFSSESFPFLDRFLADGQNGDAPGHYIGWLSKESVCYAFPFAGKWFDVGDLNSYRAADEHFSRLTR